MGWLKCNPDEIYVPNKFVLYDLPEYLPGPLADVTRALSRYVPSAIADSFGGLSVVARPMQVFGSIRMQLMSLCSALLSFPNCSATSSTDH